VIHTVGPVYHPREDRSNVLASAYRSSLQVADELGAQSVALPAISAGAYGWPLESAAEIAVRTVRATATNVAEVRFVLFGATAHEVFQRAIAELVGDAR
jgi:O-acetyl-ADP-ribose deacetylase (regulator of RNase III)